jgi:hypothetical protein
LTELRAGSRSLEQAFLTITQAEIDSPPRTNGELTVATETRQHVT